MVRGFGLCMAVACLAGAVVSAQPAPKPAAKPVPVSAADPVAAQFLKAVQAGQFATAVELTHEARERIARMEAQTPRALWSKERERILLELASAAAPGRVMPLALIEAARAFAVPGATWTLTETRRQAMSDSLMFGPYTRVSSFFAVNYSSEAQAPEVDGRLLKQTLVGVHTHGGTRGIVGVEHFAAGDEFYPVPALSANEALASARPRVEETAFAYIRPPQPTAAPSDADAWFTVKLTNNPNIELKSLEQLFDSAGFSRRPWTINNGYPNHGDVKPPASWLKWLRRPPGERGAAVFVLNEAATVTLGAFRQEGTTASATVTVALSGCTEVCAFVNRYFALPIAVAIDRQPGLSGGNPFFATYWPYHTVNGNPYGSFPTTLTYEVSFQWRRSDDGAGRRWMVTSVGGAAAADARMTGGVASLPADNTLWVVGSAGAGTGGAASSAGDSGRSEYPAGSSMAALASSDEAAAATAWDREIATGSAHFQVCRERFGACDVGVLTVAADRVSFRTEKETVFSVTPREIADAKAQRKTLGRDAVWHTITFKAAGRNFTFDYLPTRVTCTGTSFTACAEPGYTQQRIVATYLERKLTEMSRAQ